ncbi:autotransporter assembly complex protein TamA [Desulforhopalus singaporensis]|uniref:autotransporter assembly complex protein TamA n=1 Tax=Desulforhopalus singaporensis TaxID=91360 RepID=UPI000B85E0D4|nr:BamA/TamA family outer membrane protein [Desulforhopalus singaporensis]
MKFRNLLLVGLVFQLLTRPACAAVEVRVVVKGVEGALYDNVLSRLSINLQKENARLQVAGMYKLHGKATADIEDALAPYGYYHPAVTSSLRPGDDGWVAEYVIDKGEPLIIKEVDLCLSGSGKRSRTLELALQSFALRKGEILDQTVYEKEKKRLVNAAIALGFLDSGFLRKKITINRADNSGEIDLCLETGRQYVFGETSGGENVIRKSLMDRFLPYKKGEPFSEVKLYELQSTLYRTDYFREVRVWADKDSASADRVPVVIDAVAPDNLNKYSFGVGFATDTGVRAKVDWRNRLFNDRGHKIQAGLLMAEFEKSLSLTTQIPRKDPRYDMLVHSLGYQDKTWENTTTRLITASVAQEHSGPRFKFGIGLEVRDEVYDVGSTRGDATMLIPSLNGGVVFADNILNTTNGLQFSVGVLGALENVLSNVSFLQGTVNGKAIFTPVKGVRLIGRASFGATLVDSSNDLPPSLRFYTGGDTTIRGYQYRSIGTKDSSGEVIGGKYLSVQSIEVEKILGQYWSVATFWDGGLASDDLQLDYSQGVGAGLRFRLPFGQVRLDVASAVTEDGQPFMVHLNVGGDF